MLYSTSFCGDPPSRHLGVRMSRLFQKPVERHVRRVLAIGFVADHPGIADMRQEDPRVAEDVGLHTQACRRTLHANQLVFSLVPQIQVPPGQ